MEIEGNADTHNKISNTTVVLLKMERISPARLIDEKVHQPADPTGWGCEGLVDNVHFFVRHCCRGCHSAEVRSGTERPAAEWNCMRAR